MCFSLTFASSSHLSLCFATYASLWASAVGMSVVAWRLDYGALACGARVLANAVL